MQDHRKLRVYGEAQQLALQAYMVAAGLPPSERFGLASQIRRAAVSVGANIGEGCGRWSRRDFAAFLGIALGSAIELEFQLELCIQASIVRNEAAQIALQTTKRVQRMLTRLINQVRETGQRTPVVP